MYRLPISQGPHVSVESIERLTRRFATALEVAQHDHALARVQELIGYGLEVVPVAHYRAEDVVGDGFRAMVRAALGQSLHIGLLPFYFWVHQSHYGIDVAPVERIVALAHDVHVFFGHPAPPFP